MSSIFGALDKRQRSGSFEPAAAAGADLDFDGRADLLNDLLEEDATTFPLLSCPPEVLSGVLLLSDVACSVRLRPLCSAMRAAVDGDAGLWSLLTLRDFEDLGGTTKRYRDMRTLADAWDDSKAVRRLEWDPLMICAPPALRYMLLATGASRRRLWNEHGRALGAGWDWFSSKVCRRMATSTFLRWGALQYQEGALRAVAGAAGSSCCAAPEGAETDGGGGAASSGAQQFRRGRSDSVRLSAAAVSDIYETVQRWHDKAHCEMMRAHIRGASVPGEAPSTRGDAPPREFSVTPTLDAAEAAAFSAPEAPREPPGPSARGGAASRQLEEAQLKLALELSRAEAEADDAGAAAQATEGAAASPGAVANSPAGAPAAPVQGREQPSLPLHAESASAVAVFLKDHCLSERVDYLPDRLERSIEHVVAKMCTHSSWGLLYESLTEELGFRAKAAARALGACHARAVDADSAGARASLQHERMCLPIWRSSRDGVMAALSRLRQGGGAGPCAARRGLLRQATLEWCELEDLTEFLDGQLAPLEMQIDTFRGAQEVTSKAHTPHVRDIGRLLFRNLCLLDSRIFRPLCLAAYSLVHEVEDAAEGGAERGELVDILEGFHSMLVACDVADDHLSTSKRTKESFSEHLVAPISAAVDRLAEWDLRGHVSRDARRPDACFKG